MGRGDFEISDVTGWGGGGGGGGVGGSGGVNSDVRKLLKKFKFQICAELIS